jgi:hypothetical protein
MGPFSRLTTTPVTSTQFTDLAAFAANRRTYMVRAVALQSTPSGSYFNPSQGIFATIDLAGNPPPNAVSVRARLTPGGIQLVWDSVPGASYHVEAKVLLRNNDWIGISGSLKAQSNSTSFTDPSWVWYYTRWYRVISE